MVDPDFVLLLELEKRLFDNADESEFGADLESFQLERLGAVGLFLHKQLERWDYYCTPLNTLTFANTGGDGVHFGFLQIGEAGIYPVVMTVPMGGKDNPRDNNVILGENLREFLALGFHDTYFGLEQLVYDFTGALQSLNQPEQLPDIDELASFLGSRASSEELVKLKELTEKAADDENPFDPIVKEFDLKPWENIEQRLEELRQRYLPTLQIEDYEVWQARKNDD